MTEQAFGPAANRLAGLTARVLGWRPDTFWAATPAELAAVLAPDADPARAAIAPLSRTDFERLMEKDLWPHRVTPAPPPPRKA
ncbi:phage tail assembly chaperone [Novosphingobium terrae]|uniref:phage tail assembly chaperone n=1 Tax=Novosphingobium terrae TaxID=2726189 RepID=UPI0019816ACB|nr:phage tail assembly chaperone [Novosphingobium terrae]